MAFITLILVHCALCCLVTYMQKEVPAHAQHLVQAPVTIGIHRVRAGHALLSVTIDVHPVLAAFMFQLMMPPEGGVAQRSAPDEEVAPLEYLDGARLMLPIYFLNLSLL